MSDLRIAIVGCGRMGHERATASKNLGAHVVVAYDTNMGEAKKFGAEFGCEVAKEPANLDWASVDAVFVCTPPASRGPIEVMAIEHAVPVFMEKPIGLSTAQCEPILTALRSKMVMTAVGYMNRYRDSVQEVRKLVRGRNLLGASCHWLGPPYKVSWWGSRNLSGGAINEQATHLVDLARYLLGEVTEAQAIFNSSSVRDQSTGSFSISLRIEGGCLCSIFYSCQAESKMISFNIFTSEDHIQLEGWDFKIVDKVAGLTSQSTSTDKSSIFRTEVAAFLDAITHGLPEAILCNFEEALKTQRVVDAILRSVSSGKTEPIGPN